MWILFILQQVTCDLLKKDKEWLAKVIASGIARVNLIINFNFANMQSKVILSLLYSAAMLLCL